MANIINPQRSHSPGPFALLYHDPEHDPELLSASSSSSSTSIPFSMPRPRPSPSASPRHLVRNGSTHAHGQSPLNNTSSSLTVPLSSPSRSLLAAFQAASPRSHPSVSTQLNMATSSTTSMSDPPRSGLSTSAMGLRTAIVQSTLQPASPIHDSTRSSGHTASVGHFASHAFRALNGASPSSRASPVRVPSIEEPSV